MNNKFNTTILCVDDEENIINAYKNILIGDEDSENVNQLIKTRKLRNRNNENIELVSTNKRKEFDYNILTANSGEEAVICVQNEKNYSRRIAVGFFDMKMPGGIDGLETMKRILKIDPDLLCVVVTAYADSNLEQIGEIFTYQDQWIYMNKPFSRLELKQMTYHQVCAWNRKRIEEELSEEVNNLNFNLQNIVEERTNELNKKIKQLSIIGEISKKINSILDLDEVLARILNEISSFLNVEIGSILLKNEDTAELVVKAAFGPLSNLVLNKNIDIDKTTISGYVFLTGKVLLIPDISKETEFKDVLQQRKNCNSIICVPLTLKNQVIGVINLGKKNEVFLHEEQNFIFTLSDQAAMAIENADLFTHLNDNHIRTINAFASAIEIKDLYTSGHSERVSKYSNLIAQSMNLSNEEIDIIKKAALLHDIGKIGISELILNKPDKLTANEFEEIKKHPIMGIEILSFIGFPPNLIKYILYHHERLNGAGYPYKLKGEDIPLGARIIAVADAFDAMTSDRAYRKSMSFESAIENLKKESGDHFDPKIIEIFLKILEKEGNNHV